MLTQPVGDRALRIALLIRSLHIGGSERQFVVLARGLAARGHTVRIFVYVPGGALESEVTGAGVPVECVPKAGRWDLRGFLGRLSARIGAFGPDVLHSYGHVPGIFSSRLKRGLGGVPVVWGIGVARLDYSLYHWLVPASIWGGMPFSRTADRIILNSHAGLAYHASIGYPRDRMQVIPNGIDTVRFHPDPEAGRAVRTELGIRSDERVIGYVGRLDPIKDHGTFLESARGLLDRGVAARFVCVGGGPNGYVEQLRARAAALELRDRVLWLGARTDLPRVYNAMDLNTSSSLSEGLSNALAEAMACGIPCAVTDVGDSARLVGDTGAVVRSRDPDALCTAWARLLAQDRRSLAERARARVVEHYDERLFLERTEAAFRGVLRR